MTRVGEERTERSLLALPTRRRGARHQGISGIAQAAHRDEADEPTTGEVPWVRVGDVKEFDGWLRIGVDDGSAEHDRRRRLVVVSNKYVRFHAAHCIARVCMQAPVASTALEVGLDRRDSPLYPSVFVLTHVYGCRVNILPAGSAFTARLRPNAGRMLNSPHSSKRLRSRLRCSTRRIRTAGNS